MAISFASILIVSACSDKGSKDESMQGMDHSSSEDMNMDNMDNMENMDHGEEQAIELNNSNGQNELNIPPVLKSDKETDTDIYYTINAQQGETEFFKGFKTKTLGYNSSFLGPVITIKKGQNVHFNTVNSLKEETTFHWHGLEIPSEGDGGPHSVIKPGEKKEVNFKVEQEAATLWFHPHPMGDTARQVYDGLAGLIYVEDESKNTLSIPNDYGKNDFPLIFQDRTFDTNKQFNYEEVQNPDGTLGDTLLINGTINPKLTVSKEKVRLRLLNGSNMRNYVFKLSNNQTFEQIASDGGLLNEPVKLTQIQLTPGERAEIIVDFSQIKDKNIALMTTEGNIVLPFDIQNTENIQNTPLPQKMNDISLSNEETDKKVTKKIELFGMGTMVQINGQKYDMDRIDFTQKKGETEIWEIYNKPDMMGGMIHPFHIHGTQFKVLSINGEAPPANERGYKDTIALKPGDKVEIAVKFNKTGIYMYHCHILEHEENGMMGQIKVE